MRSIASNEAKDNALRQLKPNDPYQAALARFERSKEILIEFGGDIVRMGTEIERLRPMPPIHSTVQARLKDIEHIIIGCNFDAVRMAVEIESLRRKNAANTQ